MVLRRAKLSQKLFGSFPDVGNRADASHGHCKAVGENGVIEDHSGASGSQPVQSLHKGLPCLWPERKASGVRVFLDLRG